MAASISEQIVADSSLWTLAIVLLGFLVLALTQGKVGLGTTIAVAVLVLLSPWTVSLEAATVVGKEPRLPYPVVAILLALGLLLVAITPRIIVAIRRSRTRVAPAAEHG
ncbi:MAG: hypothetical protein ACK5KO_09405 [Arachnia sp.]